jgi:hypothetical protein
MNTRSGARPRHSNSRHHHSRLSLLSVPTIPRDYLERRRFFRRVSSVLMIVIFSLLIAGVIVYSSDPASFSFLRH